LQVNSATALSNRSVGLLAVASAVAVANAYYIQPLLVEVGEALSISSGTMATVRAKSSHVAVDGDALLKWLGCQENGG